MKVGVAHKHGYQFDCVCLEWKINRLTSVIDEKFISIEKVRFVVNNCNISIVLSPMNRTKPLPMILSGALIVALLIFSSTTPSIVSDTVVPVEGEPGIEVSQVMGLDLTDDQRRAEALVGSLPVEDVLGSLAPIALSPFFALTCLSGASLLSDAGLLPDSVGSNFMMSADSPLNNSAVFVGLLALTVLTAAPKLTKVSKPFAQAVDQVEAYSGIIAAVAVQVLSRVTIDEPATAEVAMVYSAGIISVSYSTLIAIFSAFNIFVVNSVKFFFEVMILISPFPTVDAIFEAINKAFTAFLIAVYLFSPWLAMVLNLLIFFISLMIFSWTYRRVVFMRCVLGDPFFGWIAEAIFRRKRMTENLTKLPRSVREELPDATVVLKAFTGKKLRGVGKKCRGFLVHSGGVSYFVQPRLFFKNKVVQLSGEGIYPSVEPGFFTHGVAYRNGAGDTVYKILFTKRYNNTLDAVHRALNARGEAVTAADAPTFKGMGQDIASKIKSASKADLRSEFA